MLDSFRSVNKCIDDLQRLSYMSEEIEVYSMLEVDAINIWWIFLKLFVVFFGRAVTMLSFLSNLESV